MRIRFRTGVPMLFALSLIVSGCSFGSNETMTETDPPPVSYVDQDDNFQFTEVTTNFETEASTETIVRELYLIDQNGLVAPQTLQLPKVEGVAKQAVEYLIQDGPVSQLLPNGFQAVLPAGTEIYGVNIKDGVAIVDFSEQFKEYRPEDELRILQSLTWTLTQFDSVETVKIQINGYDQELMPVNGTPIGQGFSRANGINHESDHVVDFSNSKSVTLYFLAQAGDQSYFVPVTRRISNTNEDRLQMVVNELIKGPSNFSRLLTDLRHGVTLLEEPHYANGVVTVNFNEALLNLMEGSAISNEVLNMFVLSLTEQAGVEKVAVQVNGDEVLMATGEYLSEPVSRPLKVNKVKY